MEVRRYTIFQIFCLAHINYCVILVVILICPWLVRKTGNDVLQIGKSVLVFFFCHLVTALFMVVSKKIVTRETFYRFHIEGAFTPYLTPLNLNTSWVERCEERGGNVIR